MKTKRPKMFKDHKKCRGKIFVMHSFMSKGVVRGGGEFVTSFSKKSSKI